MVGVSVLVGAAVAVAVPICVGAGVRVGVSDGGTVAVTVGVQRNPPISDQWQYAGVEVGVEVGLAVGDAVGVTVGVLNEMTFPLSIARRTSVWVGVGKGWSMGDP